jgi:hypothetical protein
MTSRLTPNASWSEASGGGISHHPDEHVEVADVGARVLLRLIENFRANR